MCFMIIPGYHLYCKWYWFQQPKTLTSNNIIFSNFVFEMNTVNRQYYLYSTISQAYSTAKMPRYTVLMGRRKTTNRNNTKNHMSTVILLVYAYSSQAQYREESFTFTKNSWVKKRRTRASGVTSTSSQQWTVPLSNSNDSYTGSNTCET